MKGDKNEYRKGLWTEEEDRLLMEHVRLHGKGKWNRIPKFTGLKRCGKSCRLRWMNYLSPNIKRGDFSEEEEDLIIRLHNLLGNRWSLIAGRVPGRTDNQVKNHWNTHLCKRLGFKMGKSRADDHAQTYSKEGKEDCSITPPMDGPKFATDQENAEARIPKITSEDGSSQRVFERNPFQQFTSCNDDFQDALWSFNDDLNFDSPFFTEYQYEHALDLDFQGL